MMVLDWALLVMSNLLIMHAIVALMGARELCTLAFEKGQVQRRSLEFLIGSYRLFGGFSPSLSSLLMKLPLAPVIFPFLQKPQDDDDGRMI
jgi:hypothetical protein